MGIKKSFTTTFALATVLDQGENTLLEMEMRPTQSLSSFDLAS
jgi:hypothetical protein